MRTSKQTLLWHAEKVRALHTVTRTFVVVVCGLEVAPLLIDDTLDANLFVISQLYGEDQSYCLDLLNQIVNVNWPSA